MNLLLDTNIFLEIILDQEKSSEAKLLLTEAAEHNFYVTDYSLHSVGLLLIKRNQRNDFDRFISDLILTGAVEMIFLAAEELLAVSRISEKFHLDFDDAYQYVAAEKNKLTIVSFDGDFDRTERGRKEPAELISRK